MPPPRPVEDVPPDALSVERMLVDRFSHQRNEDRLGRDDAENLYGLSPLEDILHSIEEAKAPNTKIDDDIDEIKFGAGNVLGTLHVSIKSFERMVTGLSAPKDHLSPLKALQAQIAAFFDIDLSRALFAFQRINDAVDDESFHVSLPADQYSEYFYRDAHMRWRGCKLAAAFVLVLASSKEKAPASLKFGSTLRGGLPTLAEIRQNASQSFRGAFNEAKKTAQQQGKSTIIGVSLTDVHIFELAQLGTAQHWFSFAHNFIAGIGPEGMVIWQAWGKHGYRLDEWISRGGARVRSWDEAEDFMRDFVRLTTGKGQFDAKRNKLYKKCFDVDIFHICGSRGPERPLVPKFEAWVKMDILQDVHVQDIMKFSWENSTVIS